MRVISIEFLKNIYFYVKISFLYCIGQKVNRGDYKKDYDSISSNYDNLWIKNTKEYTLELLNKLDIPKNSKVLDLGCGTGFVTSEIAKRLDNSGEIHAVDVSSNMLDVARIRNKQHRNINFIEGDMLEEILKFPEGYFDFVISAWSFAYTNPKKILKEISRVLKKGGFLAIIVNRKGTLENIESAFLRLMKTYPQHIRKVMPVRYILPKDDIHLDKLFSLVNLKPIEVWMRDKSYVFKKGVQAYSWVKGCGAIAGTSQIMSLENISEKIGDILDTYYSSSEGISVTHRFVAGIAKK